MPMVTVSISPLQVAGIRAAIDDGNYASGSEVVREALRLWAATRQRDDGRKTRHPANGAGSDGRRVADMFAEYEAEKRAPN